LSAPERINHAVYRAHIAALNSLAALTLHESTPGHAFQMPIAMEQAGLPPFRKAYICAFGEGWALYAERLGSETGIYETPFETSGMLSYQAWRAARLAVKWRSSTRAAGAKRRWGRGSISAPFTTPCRNSARCPCRCSPNASTH
jgi:hypothetical protein